MGYYTQYELTVEGASEKVIPCKSCGGSGTVPHTTEAQEAEVIEAIVAIDGFNPLGENSKWYKHEAHMKLVSAKFPDLTLRLDGEGEEQGDVWVKEFKAGLMREAKVEVKLPKFGTWE